MTKLTWEKIENAFQAVTPAYRYEVRRKLGLWQVYRDGHEIGFPHKKVEGAKKAAESNYNEVVKLILEDEQWSVNWAKDSGHETESE